jgi:KaiC/GvpD/RAD55 family RecA-like ATPase
LTKYGLEPIDKAVGSGGGSSGFVAPNLCTIIAFTGRGKTWTTCHLTKYGLRFGNDVVVVETEMNNNKFKQRLRMCMTGMSLRDYYYNQKKAREIIERSMMAGSELHLVSEQAKLDKDFAVDQLEGIVEEIEDKTGKEQKLIIIDSPDDIDPPRGTGYNKIKYDSDISKSKAIWTWLRNYSQTNNKCIIVTSQSQRKAETLLWSTAGNIGDDINKMRRSTIGISINAFKKEVEAGYSRLLVMKNTYGPEMKACWIKNDLTIGQYIREWGEIKGLNIKDYKELLASRGIALTNTDSDRG